MADLLSGRVAVVSGVGPGLGRAIALALAEHGADLVLAARSQDSLDAVAGEVRALGRRVVHRPTDIRDEAACARLAEEAAEELGGIDVLVNNAHRGGTSHPLMASDLADWRKALDTNLFGTLHMCRAVVPHMVRRGEGRIVMIGTMGVRLPEPGGGPYATSKSAMGTLAKTLALELGPSGIRVNVLQPGWIDGPAVDAYAADAAAAQGTTAEAIKAEIAGRGPLGYIPPEEEIAGTAVYLASPLARPVTGQVIDVNVGHWIAG